MTHLTPRGAVAGFATFLVATSLSVGMAATQSSPPSTPPSTTPSTTPGSPSHPAVAPPSIAPGNTAPAGPRTAPPTNRPATPPGTGAPARPTPPVQPTRSLDPVERHQDAVPVPPSAPGATPPSDTDEDQPPPLGLDPEICDFGFVSPSATPNKVVKLKNLSDKPLTILAVQPSCKCTTVNDIAGQDIPPHGEVELNASMRAQSSPGNKKAEIKVLIDGWTRVVNIQLKMEVTLPVRISPGFINAVPGQPQSGRILVESLDKRPFSICSIGGYAPELIGFDPAIDQPRNQYLLAYDVSNYKQGEMPRHLVVETDHPDCPLVDIFLRHSFTQPKPVLKMQDYRLTVGRMEEGQVGEFLLEIGELLAGERVVSISTSMAGARVELDGEAIVDGIITKQKCKMYPPKGFYGLMYAPITIYTTQRQQDMQVWGVIVPKGHQGCLGVMEHDEGASMRWNPATKGKSAASAPSTTTPVAATTPSAVPAAPVTAPKR